MVAHRLQCWVCAKAFYGRADARYCSAACRQKSHRGRVRRRALDEAVPAPGLGDVIARAREAREAARAARERAETTRSAASKARAADETVPAPGPGDAIARAREARKTARAARERSENKRSSTSEAIAALRNSGAGDGRGD